MTKHNKFYQKLVEGMPPGIDKDVMQILSQHIGGQNRISRRMLVATIFPNPGKGWSTLDRKVRLAIEALQLAGYPVLSDSGQGGYYLADSRGEIETYIRELESRADKIKDKVRSLRNAELTGGKLEWQDHQTAVQPNLFA